MFARARVVSCSLRVAMKLGHMVPPMRCDLRHSPTPLHFSAARSTPCVALKLKTVLYPGVGWSGPWRSEVSIGGVSMIFPGLNRPAGSKVALMRRIMA